MKSFCDFSRICFFLALQTSGVFFCFLAFLKGLFVCGGCFSSKSKAGEGYMVLLRVPFFFEDFLGFLGLWEGLQGLVEFFFEKKTIFVCCLRMSDVFVFPMPKAYNGLALVGRRFGRCDNVKNS